MLTVKVGTLHRFDIELFQKAYHDLKKKLKKNSKKNNHDKKTAIQAMKEDCKAGFQKQS